MAKKRKLITRRCLKWVGTGAIAAMLVVMFASMWRAPALRGWVAQTYYLVSIKRGRLSFESDTILATGLDRIWVERTVGRFSPGIDFAPDWSSI